MAETIQEYAVERNIRFLMHFTRASNLENILKHGLVPRDVLVREGYGAYNDQYRYDGTNAVCLSIHFPNYKMFWGIRQENKDVDWVVLALRPEVLWMLPCAFCATNAASAAVAAVPLEQRKGLAALQSMYADWGDKSRATLGIPNSFPTNPQAEVLMLNGVPREYIAVVIVLTSAKQRELQAQYPGLDVRVHAEFFSYRQDYAHWKKES
ncbi:DarT ssDNA thymidine ADP-ribosyltransferase family protein [uncultured Massilia sp.]|uniref:DarT ssDNA thymidine ADP-ribosyltransferase family protein n=1 Tax=uncultured Massilia sp. TaxID=169973 RepID=UPI00258DD484|nr:DarT ssDNA thymidine ADP-ribosyltransferase family protein [uncultured Massilia sp.]